MKRILLIIIVMGVMAAFSNICVSAFSDTLQNRKGSAQSDREDQYQGCMIGDELSCTVSMESFDTLADFTIKQPLSFKTTDVNGNPIDSMDIFSNQKVTMIKIWSVTCPHCINEIPELMKLNDKFEALGAQVIGIVYDADETDEIFEAKKIINDLDVNFINLLPNQAIWNQFQTQIFPSTVFVNEKGEILGDPLLGSEIRKYEELLSLYLEQDVDY